MKKLLSVIIGLSLIGGSVINAQQITNITPVSFIHTVGSYFTSHNLELTNTFGSGHKFDLWTSIDSIQGNGNSAAHLADAIGISYVVYDHISLENVLRTSGIAGTIMTEQFGVGLNYTVIDTKLTLYADAGYDKGNSLTHSKFQDNLFGEVGLRVKKALTENTYAGIGLGLQFPSNVQVYQVVAGFTF